jgi:hypothetical protein
MENTKMKVNQKLTRNVIISSIIWAAVILGCSFSMDGSNKEIIYILSSGFLMELIRISSSNKGNKQEI